MHIIDIAKFDGNTEETVALKVKDVSIIKIKPGFCA
jgi:hypothetical protein